jgi:hypothetical protein
MKFTVDSWPLKHIKLHHPEHLPVAHLNTLPVCSTPRRVEPAQHYEFNTNQDSVEDLKAFSYLGHVANIADSQSQTPPPPLPWMGIYHGAGALLSDYIGVPWECDT